VTRRGGDPPLRYEWERTVKALPLPSWAKHVGLNLATYVDADGGGAFPGVERTVADTGLSDSSARRAYKLLRDVGLIVRTFEGARSGRRGTADVYRLAIPDDVLARVVNATPPVSQTGARRSTTGQGDRWSEGDHRSARPEPPVSQTEPPVSQTRTTGQGDTPPTHVPTQPPTHLPTHTAVLDVTTDRARPLNGRTRR
jgi:hypothetical protein